MKKKDFTRKNFLNTIISGTLGATLVPNIYGQKGINGDSSSSNDFYPILPWNQMDSNVSLEEISNCNFTIGGFIKPNDIYRAEDHDLKAIIKMDLNIPLDSTRSPRSLSDFLGIIY